MLFPSQVPPRPLLAEPLLSWSCNPLSASILFDFLHRVSAPGGSLSPRPPCASVHAQLSSLCPSAPRSWELNTGMSMFLSQWSPLPAQPCDRSAIVFYFKNIFSGVQSHLGWRILVILFFFIDIRSLSFQKAFEEVYKNRRERK